MARLTQAQVGEAIGVSQNTYSYWENGKVKIDNESLGRLATLFNVSIDYLLNREVVENSEDSDLWELREQLRRRPGMRILFSATKDASDEDLLKTVKILEALKGDKDDAN